MHRAIAALLVVLALVLGAPPDALAQGVLRGSVHDSQGTPIRGAAVVVPGTTLATETDLEGRYRIAVVPAGAVRVHAAAIGYGFVDTTVALTGGDSTIVNFILSLAPLALPPVDVISDKVSHFGDRPATSARRRSGPAASRSKLRSLKRSESRCTARSAGNCRRKGRRNAGGAQRDPQLLRSTPAGALAPPVLPPVGGFASAKDYMITKF